MDFKAFFNSLLKKQTKQSEINTISKKKSLKKEIYKKKSNLDKKENIIIEPTFIKNKSKIIKKYFENYYKPNLKQTNNNKKIYEKLEALKKIVNQPKEKNLGERSSQIKQQFKSILTSDLNHRKLQENYLEDHCINDQTSN